MSDGAGYVRDRRVLEGILYAVLGDRPRTLEEAAQILDGYLKEEGLHPEIQEFSVTALPGKPVRALHLTARVHNNFFDLRVPRARYL